MVDRDDDALALLESRHGEHVVGGDEDGQRRGRFIGDAVRNGVGPHRPRDCDLGVGTGVRERRHPLADAKIVHAVADGDDRADAVESRRKRRRRAAVPAAPAHDVGEVDAGRDHADREFARPPHRIRDLAPLQNRRITEPVDDDSVRVELLPRRYDFSQFISQ